MEINVSAMVERNVKCREFQPLSNTSIPEGEVEIHFFPIEISCYSSTICLRDGSFLIKSL